MGQFCFGVDVGGTSIKLGLFNNNGNIIDKWEIPTRTIDQGCHILSDIRKSVERKIEERELLMGDCVGVGVGVPGPVGQDGTVYTAVNLGWGKINVNKELGTSLGLPVKTANDANVAALGEMWQGGAKGHRNIVLATLGTGVGGGIIIDGKIVSGSRGAGGEIGHMHVKDEEKIPCNCGNKGCLEQYASATGIVRLAKEMLEQSKENSVLAGRKISAKTVFDGVKQKDTLAIMVVEKFGEYLGKALAQIASVCDPEIFVLGGGVSKAGNILIEYVSKYYKKYAFDTCRNAEFALAKLENDAGIYGSAKLVLE